LLKLVLERRMDGKRPQGRPRFGMIDDLKERSYVKMKRSVEDRVAWKCWMPGPAEGREQFLNFIFKFKLNRITI